MAGSARLSALSRHLLGANPTDGYSADMSEGTTRGAHLVARRAARAEPGNSTRKADPVHELDDTLLGCDELHL